MVSKIRVRIGDLALVAAVTALGVVAGGSPLAAEQSDTGSLAGAVTDELGGVLPGATVTARNTATGLSRSAISGASGDYEMARLPAGSYEVDASLPGFRGQSATVSIGASAASLDLTLAIAPLAETVNVTRSDRTLASVPARRGGGGRRRDRLRRAEVVARRGVAWHPWPARPEPPQLRPVRRHRAEHPRAAAAVRPARPGHHPGRHPDHDGRRHHRAGQRRPRIGAAHRGDPRPRAPSSTATRRAA